MIEIPLKRKYRDRRPKAGGRRSNYAGNSGASNAESAREGPGSG